MANEFVTDLLDMFPSTITGIPGSVDNEGTWTPSGTPVTVPCRYEGQRRMVRNAHGQEVTSTVQAIIAGTPGFTPEGYRFTISSRFKPNTNLAAINVVPEDDEDGPCYEEAYFS